MKILACVGSYRKNGNTNRAVGMILDQLSELAAQNNDTVETEIVYLGHEEIRMCRGCRVCFDKGETYCPHKDGLQAIVGKMSEADGIVVATPVYVNDVNGIVKNWIDRLAYVCHRPEFAGKYAYLVATAGDGPTNHALRTLNKALLTWGFFIVGKVGLKTGAWMSEAEMKAHFRKKVDRSAKSFFEAIRKRKAYRPSFLSLMTFKIQQRYWQRATQDSIDHDYWRARGWTEPQREFYIQHETGRINVAVARLAGAVLGRFVT